jgi:TPR repeat protein
VAQDSAEAMKWYRRAADRGFPPAEVNLGVWYETGKGVAQDYAEAVNLYRKAAEQGLAIAQNNLGSMYYRGLGVPKNLVQAYLWYTLAAPQHKDAGKDVEFVSRQMTPAEITEAQKLVMEWKPAAAR